MLRLLCSSIVLLFLIPSLSIAETQENYLAVLTELENLKELCEVISADQESYNDFSFQQAVTDIKFRELETPTYATDGKEKDMYLNIEWSYTHFIMVGLYWNNANLFSDQEDIDEQINQAELERNKAILYLEAAWESYNRMFSDDYIDPGIQKYFLIALQEFDKLEKLSQFISVDKEKYNSFSYQQCVAEIAFSAVGTTSYFSDQKKRNLYQNIETSLLHFILVGSYWNNVNLLSEQEDIEEQINQAELERDKAILYLEAAWEKYNTMDFDGDNNGDGTNDDGSGSSGGGGGGFCFISSVK